MGEPIREAVRAGTLTLPHARVRGIECAPRVIEEVTQGRYVGAVIVEL